MFQLDFVYTHGFSLSLAKAKSLDWRFPRAQTASSVSEKRGNQSSAVDRRTSPRRLGTCLIRTMPSIEHHLVAYAIKELACPSLPLPPLVDGIIGVCFSSPLRSASSVSVSITVSLSRSSRTITVR